MDCNSENQVDLQACIQNDIEGEVLEIVGITSAVLMGVGVLITLGVFVAPIAFDAWQLSAAAAELDAAAPFIDNTSIVSDGWSVAIDWDDDIP